MYRLRPRDFSSLLKGCTALRDLKSVHAAMLRSHLHPDVHFLTTELVSQYSLLGSMDHAHAVFSFATPSYDASLWHALIRGYTENGPQEQAIALFHQMREIGVGHEYHVFPVVIKACSRLRDLEEGKKVHQEAEELGHGSNVILVNALIGMYGKCGCLDVSRQLFDEIPEKTVVSWSAIIGAYAQNGRQDEAFSLFSRMLAEGVQPNRGAFMNMSSCIFRSDDADRIYRLIVDYRFELDPLIQNAVVRMYARCGRVDTAWRLFNGMPDRDLELWNSMIEAYAQSDSPVEVLKLFTEMKVLEILPDYATVHAVIRACSSLASLELACSVHGFILKNFSELNIKFENALVGTYVKCGSLRTARWLFDQMSDRDSNSWRIMLSGCGMHGLGKDALNLFDKMKASLKPDRRTFLSVLSACSHAGLVEEGQQIFNSMDKEFGIIPEAEHYACMVQLMGRAGQLKEALQFIKTMPIEPDSSVWGALLAACRNHSNIELAELAAKSLLDIDPENSRCHVILSNIYNSSGKREEADQIEGLMNQRGVKKTSGHSFVEVRNSVYKFLVGDRSNPQANEIYEELERLMESIKKKGYVPTTELVLHDIEEETKEATLHAHSEKLAIVFGLLNSEPESEILVHKNLSICVDCHTFTKFISKVTGQEIMVRDSNRFHKFKDGTCSCGDYW